MKTLTVNLREARRANDVISNIRHLNNMLEPTCSNEWLLQTEDADEEDALIETIHFYFNITGIESDEYEITTI